MRFDVALSFSYDNDALASAVQRELAGLLTVFYWKDERYLVESWGELLCEYLPIQYRAAQQRVVLWSMDYATRVWPRLEWAVIESLTADQAEEEEVLVVCPPAFAGKLPEWAARVRLLRTDNPSAIARELLKRHRDRGRQGGAPA